MANAAPEQSEVLAACISLWRTFAHLLLTHFSGVFRVSSREKIHKKTAAKNMR